MQYKMTFALNTGRCAATTLFATQTLSNTNIFMKLKWQNIEKNWETLEKWQNNFLVIRDVVLGTCTCTQVVIEYHFKVLVLVLESQVLVDMWQVLYFYFLIFKQYALW